MIKRILHRIFGYMVIITFLDGREFCVRAYLCSDCTVRARLKGVQIHLESNGCVRGLWSHNETKWRVK